MPDAPAGRAGSRTVAGPGAAPVPVPRLLCDVQALAAAGAPSAGARWKLAEPGRQLDANLVHLPAGGRVDTHAEPDLDVLFLVVAGHGRMDTDDSPIELADGALCWLPHGSTRRITAGADGLSYVTVHRRRPGMRIQSRPR